jgi:quercetin dioxygenase-like cupin family protein
MSNYALFLCIGCIGATLMVAQAAAPELEIIDEPHHHLTFENQFVRVFNVQVDPNTQTGMHWHRHDYIAVTLGDAEVSNTVKNKPAVTAKLADGQTVFASGNFAHIVGDIGSQPFRNVTVELLQDASLRNSYASGKIHWDLERGLSVLDRGTAQVLFVKDGIRVTEFELQPGGTAPAQISPRLLVAVTDLYLHIAPEGQSSAPFNLKSGDHKWLSANHSHSVTNTGSSPAKFVILEFPE